MPKVESRVLPAAPVLSLGMLMSEGMSVPEVVKRLWVAGSGVLDSEAGCSDSEVAVLLAYA